MGGRVVARRAPPDASVRAGLAGSRTCGYPLDPGEFLATCREAEDVPGARLAILRTDLSLRWDSGDRVGVRWYLDRFPDLPEEACVALIYEEFCLREDEGEAVDSAEFLSGTRDSPNRFAASSRSTS